MIVDEGCHLVSGWKKKRLDPMSKTIPTKLYNWATRIVSGIQLHDFNLDRMFFIIIIFCAY